MVETRHILNYNIFGLSKLTLKSSYVKVQL